MGFLIDKTLSYSNFSHLSAVKRVECNLYKIAFGFQIYKGIPINEHIRMKPNKFSTQGWFNKSMSISFYVIYHEDLKYQNFIFTLTYFHIKQRLLMVKKLDFHINKHLLI